MVTSWIRIELGAQIRIQIWFTWNHNTADSAEMWYYPNSTIIFYMKIYLLCQLNKQTHGEKTGRRFELGLDSTPQFIL